MVDTAMMRMVLVVAMHVSYHWPFSWLVWLALTMVGLSLNVKEVVGVGVCDATEAILNAGAFEEQCQPWWIVIWCS